MKKFTLLVAVWTMVAFGAAGCKKQQPPPPQTPPQGAPGMPGMPGTPGAPQGEMGAPPVEKKVVVPDAVKGSWKAVKGAGQHAAVQLQSDQKQTTTPYTSAPNDEDQPPALLDGGRPDHVQLE